MPAFLIEFHSIFRWVVLIAAIAALVFAIMSATGSRRWDALSDRLSLAFTITLDIQFLIGVILWVSEQRWTLANDTFLTFAHPLLMFGAVAVAHIGRARAERAKDDKTRGTTTAIFFGASLAIILVMIPLYAWPL